MNQSPRVVHYVDWDIVLKCKSGKYASKEECLKSIWTEEYGNPIEYYDVRDMISIMGQVIEEIVPTEQRGRLLDKFLFGKLIGSTDGILDELYVYLQLLQVREREFLSTYRDLYIIEKDGKYYTIDQYDELKESESNCKENPRDYAEWLIPVTKEAWTPGYFGMCSSCGYVNSGHTKIIPNFCEKCGRPIKNGNL